MSDDDIKDAEAMLELTDCKLCYGEGWHWDDDAGQEVPCRPCNGLGFRTGHRRQSTPTPPKQGR